MFCPKCGTKAIEGAGFCQKCGAKLICDNEQPQTNTAPITSEFADPTSTPPEDTEKETDTLADHATVHNSTGLDNAGKATDALTVYALLSTNAGACSEIKSADRVMKGALLRCRTFNHLVYIADGGVRIRSTLAFPFAVLYVISAVLFICTVFSSCWASLEYGSFHLEPIHNYLFAVCFIAVGLVVTLHSVIGRNEKMEIAIYVRDIVEAEGIRFSQSTKKPDISRKGLIVALLLFLLSVIFVASPTIYSRYMRSESKTLAQAYKPFEESMGLPYTCEEVFNQYFPDVSWWVWESGNDEYHVQIEAIDSTSDFSELKVTLSVCPKSTVPVQINSLEIWNDQISGEELRRDADCEKIIQALFTAYDERQSDLSEFWNWLDEGYVDGIGSYQNDFLLETYVDDKNGLSFRYPTDWVLEDLSEQVPYAIASVTERGYDGYYARMAVCIYQYEDWVFNGSASDFNQKYSDNEYIRNYNVEDISDIVIDGKPARRVMGTGLTTDVNQDDAAIAAIFYFYKMDSLLYSVECACRAESFDYYSPYFEAIMDSYIITATVPTVSTEYPGQIVFESIPASSFLDEHIDTVIDNWGIPIDYNDGYGDNYCVYDAIEFAFDYEGLIFNVQMDAEHCTFDGTALNTTRDKLIEVLGNPTEEGEATQSRRVLFEGIYYDVEVYYMTFLQSTSGMGIRIEFDKDSSTASYVYLWRL